MVPFPKANSSLKHMTIYDFNDKEKVTLGMIFRLKFSFSSANIIDTRIEAQ